MVRVYVLLWNDGCWHIPATRQYKMLIINWQNILLCRMALRLSDLHLALFSQSIMQNAYDN